MKVLSLIRLVRQNLWSLSSNAQIKKSYKNPNIDPQDTHFIKNSCPLFLIGAPRSGTTLLCRFLRAHPAVLMTNEAGVFLQMHNLITKASKGRAAGVEFGKEYCDIWSECLAENALELIYQYYAKISKIENRKTLSYWGDKHPHYNHCLEAIHSWLPQARYIYLIRNPLDIVCSIASMNNWDYQQAFTAWTRFSTSYETFYPKVKSEHLMMLKYEDLSANPVQETEKIFIWLGLQLPIDVKQEILRLSKLQSHSIRNRSLTKRNKREDGVEHNPLQASVDRWKDELSAADVKAFRSQVTDYFKKYSY